MNFERMAQFGFSRLERIRVRSALNPIIWLAVSVPIISWAAAFVFRDQFLFACTFIAMGGLPIIVAVLAYVILLFRSPDRLQSEEYLLHLREINLRYRQNRKPERYNEANQPVQYQDSRARIDDGERP
jgi:hypothetical protein